MSDEPLSSDSYSARFGEEPRQEPIRKMVCTGVHSRLVAITLPSDAQLSEVTHQNSDRVVFVAEGTGVLILNGNAEAVREHDAIFIPAGTTHEIRNSGSRDLKIFLTCSPPLANTADQATTNFYAIAQSTTPAEHADVNMRQPFPGGIKWTSWKSPAVRNVLFATDFSPVSDGALPYAISIAQHYRSTLYVAHIINPEMYGLLAAQTIESLLTNMRQAATSKIEELITSRYGGDVQYEPAIAEGAVQDALLDLVRTKSIDLLVLGTHGRRGFRKLVLGSVAEEIYRLAPCPVLTVGPRVSDTRSKPLQLRHIIYPMEISGDVVATAGYAISIAKEYGAELTFLSVIEEPMTSADERAWINAAAQHWFEDKLGPDVGIGDRSRFVQKFGDPASAILQCAAEESADLIVMSVHGAHPAVAGRVPGIAHRVVAEASCPVLTVR